MPFDTQFYLSAIDHLADPSRKTRWRMLIPPEILKSTGYNNTNAMDLFAADSPDELALHIKTCTIPNMQYTQQGHNYMGFKSNYVVNAKLDADFPFQAILLEDMRAYEAILAWQQGGLNTGLLASGNDGAAPEMFEFTTKSNIKLGLGHHKDNKDLGKVVRNNIVKCEMYNWYNGSVILTVTLINAFPTLVGGWQLDYSDAGGLNMFNFTLHCDRWEVKVTTNGAAPTTKSTNK